MARAMVVWPVTPAARHPLRMATLPRSAGYEGDGNTTTTDRTAGPPGLACLRDPWGAVAGRFADVVSNPKSGEGRSDGDMAEMALRRQSGTNRIIELPSNLGHGAQRNYDQGTGWCGSPEGEPRG